MALWTAFMLGLAGSLHCAGMCGPLVLALSRARTSASPATAGCVCYHLGRILSYATLGLVAGLLGLGAASVGMQRGLSVVLGLLLLVGILTSLAAPLATPIMRVLAAIKQRFIGRLPANPLLGQAVLGGLNGLLPCGLVYVAALTAAGRGSPLSAAGYMICFGLGTWPVMLSIHATGQRLRLPGWVSLPGLTRGAAILMAALLILRGLQLDIPYLSPAVGSVCGHCH